MQIICILKIGGVIMKPTVILIVLATILSTFLGGLFALKFKDRLHLILGFSAGAIIGVAFFDLLPEAINLASKVYGVNLTISIVALGFVIYMMLDRLMYIYTLNDGEEGHAYRGKLGAGSLFFHSFLDGLAIGLAFQVSSSVGAVVATAVLVHDFSDGINTVNLVLKNHGGHKQAFRWLIIDAIAPALGAASTLLFTLPEATLGLILANFCGFFLYIGASDLLPESHHRYKTLWTTIMTLLGMLTLYIAIRLANL